MKRVKIISVLIVLVCAVLVSPAAGKYSGGTGEPDNPYQIADPNDLLELAGNTGDYDEHFILTADINLALAEPNVFTTALIAPDTNPSANLFQGSAFEGKFDGGGFIISNLRINDGGAGNDYLGLFGQIGSSAQIINLGLENCNITGGNTSEYNGGLCGRNHGSISNSYATGVVNGGADSSALGGLCGVNEVGSISNSYATVTVTGGNNSYCLGGLCGMNGYGGISNCHATGAVTSGEDSDYLGGLCGFISEESSISNCHATGAVTGGEDSSSLGGLCGYVVGWGIIISDCYATGTVSGEHSDALGGLCGDNLYGEFSNCYARGAVNGNIILGGLCGNTYDGVFENCYATGTVTGDLYLGGLCGFFYRDLISNCYFLDTAGPDNGFGTPLTDEQMRQKNSFVGWNFVSIWDICEGMNYPRLAWQIPLAGDFVCPDGVEMRDYAYFANWWLEDNCSEMNNCGGTDRDLSGTVEVLDLYLWVGNWLEGID